MQLSQQNQVILKIGNNPKAVFFTDSKKKFQYIFKFMYLIASIFSAILLHKIYLFQTLPQFQQVRKGKIVDLLYYSLPFGTAFTIFDLSIHYLLDDLCEKYYLDQKKYVGKARSKRSYSLVKWAYSLCYYFISSIAAYYLIKDTNFFPTWLGGSGSCMNQYYDAPNLPSATYPMKLFYLFQLGKHASRLFSHIFIRPEGNYYEYVLHHSLSTFLIFFSYLTNQWLIGIMVLLCHDASDFFLILSRGYKDYKNYSKKILQIIYVFALIFWVFGRLVIYPLCCVYASLFAPSQVESQLTYTQRQILMLPYRWMGFMLLFLLMLHGFWTYYIGKAFVEVSISQKIATNTYQ